MPKSKLKVGTKFCFNIDYLYEFNNSLPELATYFIKNNIVINDIFEIVEVKVELFDGKRYVGANKIKRLSDGKVFDFADTGNEYYSCFINDACDDEYDLVE